MIVKSVEKKENNKVSFEVEVSREEFEVSVQAAYLKNKKNISVPGFRKGKAPRMVIEGMYGTGVFYEDAIDDMAPKAFKEGVEKEALKAVGRPELTNANVNDDKSLTLAFETALYPPVTLGQYKGVEAPRESVNITDEDVDKYLDEMRKRNGRQVTVEREAKLGDTVTIDYAGYLDGELFPGGKDENHKLELGSNSFVEGFESQLVGIKAGEEKDLDVTFPENYHADLAGKAVVFKVKCHEVTETQLPELDDEFAKDVSEFDNLAEYRVAVKEELEKARVKAVDEDFGYAVMQKAVENMTCDVPEAMIVERMDSMVSEYDRNLMAQGMRLEEYLRMMGMDPAGFQNMIRPQAEAQVRTDILLGAVVEAENIQVSAEELDTAIESIANAYHTTVENIKNSLPVGSMEDDMRKKKASDLIMETAVATAPEAEQEEKPKAKKTTKKAPKKEAAEPADQEKTEE